MENAIDAGAGQIEVVMREGGRSFIAVTDDGHGMSPQALVLAVERHATSKLPDDDLVHIQHLGFRGEALPSIGAVARVTLISRPPGAAEAYRMTVEGGRKGTPQPVGHPPGTRIEVRDLFYATPARLKFLKSPRSELGQAKDTLARLAMAHPAIGFSLRDGERKVLFLPATPGDLFEARLQRLAAIMGKDFQDNALRIEAEREGLRLTGYAGLPTLNRANAQQQHLFVDGRPVRDKLLFGAVRGAYQDFLARDRHPLLALFLEVPPSEVDVNVHPAKAEVRFREPGLVRGLIVSAIRHALAAAGHRASTTVSHSALGALRAEQPAATGPGRWQGGYPSHSPAHLPRGLAEAGTAYHAPLPGLATAPAGPAPTSTMAALAAAPDSEAAPHPLGAARAQLHQTYVVAQTADGIVIVDQHAAHERLVYETMKQQIAASGVPRQMLLLPEVVELEEGAVARLSERVEELAELGLVIEPFGPARWWCARCRACWARYDAQGLLRDLADELEELGEALALRDRLERGLRNHGLPRLGARRAGAQSGGNERPAAADGGNAPFRTVQPWPADLCRAEACRTSEKLFGRR